MVEKFNEVRNGLVELESVFDETDGPYINFTKDFKGRIDYILHNNKIQLRAKERLIELEIGNELPNREFPSDHIPLICQFT